MGIGKLFKSLNHEDFINKHQKKEIGYYEKNSFDLSLVDINKVVDFLKDPAKHDDTIRYAGGFKYPLFPEPELREEMYQQLQKLEGDEFWKFICENQYTLAIGRTIQLFPEIKQICKELYQIFNNRMTTFFLTSFDSKVPSLLEHADMSDIFIIQLIGTKRWQFPLDGNGKRFTNYKNYQDFHSFDDPSTYEELLMEPGDVIFVPYRQVHRVTQITKGLSVHLMLSFDRDNHFQIQKEITEYLTRGTFNPEETLKDFNLQSEEFDQYIEQVFASLRKKVNDIDLDKFKEQYIEKRLLGRIKSLNKG